MLRKNSCSKWEAAASVVITVTVTVGGRKTSRMVTQGSMACGKIQKGRRCNSLKEPWRLLKSDCPCNQTNSKDEGLLGQLPEEEDRLTASFPQRGLAGLCRCSLPHGALRAPQLEQPTSRPMMHCTCASPSVAPGTVEAWAVVSLRVAEVEQDIFPARLLALSACLLASPRCQRTCCGHRHWRTYLSSADSCHPSDPPAWWPLLFLFLNEEAHILFLYPQDLVPILVICKAFLRFHLFWVLRMEETGSLDPSW